MLPEFGKLRRSTSGQINYKKLLYFTFGFVLIQGWGSFLPDRKSCLSALIVCFLISWISGAQTPRSLSFVALIQHSDCIVYGRVVQSHSLYDSATRMNWTETEIQVLDVLKGKIESEVVITEPGSIVNGIGEIYPGSLQFRASQEIVAFLSRASGNRLRVTGAIQGIYAVVLDQQNGERWVQPSAPPREVIYEEGSPYERNIRAQGPGVDRLDRFLQSIRQKASQR